MHTMSSMKFDKLVCFIIIICCIILTCVSEENKDRFQVLDKIIPKVLACENLAGVSILVSQNGERLFYKGYGKSNIKGNISVEENVLYSSTGVTETFTAALLGKLLHEKG